jgi:hypothetical protein
VLLGEPFALVPCKFSTSIAVRVTNRSELGNLAHCVRFAGVLVTNGLVDTIEGWEAAKNWVQLAALNHYLQRELNEDLSDSDVRSVLESLAIRGRVELQDGKMRLSEPECVETELYDKLEPELKRQELLRQLGVRSESFVLQNTSVGGPRSGPLTRPDFTLAAIQSWRFDPHRTLDVFSFEVKNRAGASIAAVYEAVAHGRLVHYPHLVCPRSKLYPDTSEEIRKTSLAEGVGLILFDISQNEKGDCSVDNLELQVEAERRSPNPLNVEKYLESRLTPDNADVLHRMSKGAVP